MKKSLNKAKKKTIIADGFSIRIGIIPKISVGNTLYSPSLNNNSGIFTAAMS